MCRCRNASVFSLNSATCCRGVRARTVNKELGVADAALQAIRETRLRELIMPDLRRRGNVPEMSFHVVSENGIRLLDEIGH